MNNHKVHTRMATATRPLSRPQQFTEQAVPLMPSRTRNDRPLSQLLTSSMTTNLDQTTRFGIQTAHKAKCPPTVYNVLVNGLYAGRGAPLITTHDEDDMIQNIKQQQQRLGWKQIYYGRLAAVWATGITESQATIQGVVFYSRVMILIWKAVVEQWMVRNSHLHPPSTTMDDRTQLEYIVHQIIQEAQADPELQDLVTAFDPEVLLRRPIKHIRHWITNSKNHMLAHQKAATIRAQIHTKDIRTYFPVMYNSTEPSMNDKNLLRPP